MANGTKTLGQKDKGTFQPLFAPLGSAPKVTNNVVYVRTEGNGTPTMTKGKVVKR
jgi:hypothetical protein